MTLAGLLQRIWTALRGAIAWRLGLAAAGARELRRWRTSGGPTRARLHDLARYWFEGGWDLSATLAPAADGAARRLRLVVQPDGDVLLCVPSDFGQLADDHAQARRFMSEANRQLAEIRSNLSVDWSALLFLTFEAGGALIAVICGVEGLTGLATAPLSASLLWLGASALMALLGRQLAVQGAALLGRMALTALRKHL